MKRLKQIAKELNISSDRVLTYLRNMGYHSFNMNSNITLQLENSIKNLHLANDGSEQEDIIDEAFDDNLLPKEFRNENPYLEEIQTLMSRDDIFENRREKLVSIGEKTFETIFSDFEAFTICIGLEDRRARLIARKFFKSNSCTEDEIIEAHEYAKATYEKYGGKLLSNIITLPPLPFKAINAVQLFSEIDKRKRDKESPVVRFAYQNTQGEKEKINITYYTENVGKSRIQNQNVVTVRNRTTGELVMTVSRDGRVLPSGRSGGFVPFFKVFRRFSENTKEYIHNYGLETGECSECGRELTDPKSIHAHIGPICKQYL